MMGGIKTSGTEICEQQFVGELHLKKSLQMKTSNPLLRPLPTLLLFIFKVQTRVVIRMKSYGSLVSRSENKFRERLNQIGVGCFCLHVNPE